MNQIKAISEDKKKTSIKNKERKWTKCLKKLQQTKKHTHMKCSLQILHFINRDLVLSNSFNGKIITKRPPPKCF